MKNFFSFLFPKNPNSFKIHGVRVELTKYGARIYAKSRAVSDRINKYLKDENIKYKIIT